MAEARWVRFGRSELRYQVERSARRRTVSIMVTASGVTVKAPLAVDDDRLAALVHSRGGWIVAKQVRFAAVLSNAPSPQALVEGAAVRYLGRQHRVWRVPGLTAPRLNGRRLEVAPGSPEEVRGALEGWYRQQAERVLGQRVRRYARRLGVVPTAVLVRDQRSRWGSCNARGELRFNWRVVLAPMSLIDYVVAHELCHLEHMNHSPAFWARLAQLLPDYEQRREQLALDGPKFTV